MALAGCHLVDKFRIQRTADRLEELKDFVRLGLQDASAQLATYRDRDRRRRAHFDARIGRKPELGPRIRAHVAALRLRSQLYSDRRRMLREIADGAVWVLLGFDIRRTAFLYKAGGHDLSTGAALAGVIQLQRDLHQSGEFLAIETDLTRCAGFGDLLVVMADGRSVVPLMLEVKTHAPPGELVAGTVVEVLSLTAGSGHPIDQDALDKLQRTIGRELKGELVVSDRAEKQLADIAERTGFIARVLNTGARGITPPSRNWKALRRVIGRAHASGYSFDLAERGVYYFALRPARLRNLKADLLRVRDRIKEFSTGQLVAGASHQVHEHEEWSGLIPPISVWDLSVSVRADLLTNDTVVGTFAEVDLFRRLFAEQGVTLTEHEGEWILAGEDGRTATLGGLYVRSIQLGATIGGMSPKSVVSEMVAALRQSDAS